MATQDSKSISNRDSKRKSDLKYRRRTTAIRIYLNEALRLKQLKDKLNVNYSNLITVLINCYAENETNRQDYDVMDVEAHESGYAPRRHSANDTPITSVKE